MTIIKSDNALWIDALQLFEASLMPGGLTSSQRQQLRCEAVFIQLDNQQTLFYQDQLINYWYLIINGRIDTLRYGDNGEELIYKQRQRGQLLAALVIFMPSQRYPVQARAAEMSLVCRWPAAVLKKLCHTQPEIALRLLALAGNALCGTMDVIESFIHYSTEQRLARYFLKLYAAQGELIVIPLTQRLLANQLGVRVETLNRLLSAWKKRGYLTGKGMTFRLNDIAQFQRISEGNK